MDIIYKRCAECGLEEAEWKGSDGEGYFLYGEWYCCEGCASSLGCSCHGQRIQAGHGWEDWVLGEL